MNKTICSLIFCLSVSACSTKWGSFFKSSSKTEQEHEKIMAEFEVPDEVKEKFLQGTPSSTSVEKKQEEPVKEVKAKAVSKPKTQAKAAEIKKEEVKTEVASPVVAEVSKDDYPVDFPEEFKEIDKNSQKFWNKQEWVAKVGERTHLDINYLGVTAGKIVISLEQETEIGGRPVHHINARLKSAPFYRYIYELDDSVDTYVLKGTKMPLKFSLIQRESSQDVDDLQLFDQDAHKAYWYWKRKTKDGERKRQREEFIPRYFQDPLSVIFFLRGMPLKVGDEYSIPIINKGKVEMLTSKVEKYEKIKTDLGEKEAIRVKAYTKYTGETLKSGDMVYWFSAEGDHHFLKFQAKIKLGSISGDVTKIEK